MTEVALSEVAKVEENIAALVKFNDRTEDGNNHLENGMCELKGAYMRNS